MSTERKRQSTVKLADSMLQGGFAPSRINELLELSTTQRTELRKKLEGGRDLFPALKPFVRVRPEVHEILLSSDDDAQIQRALDLITKPVYIYQMKQENPLIISVWRLAKDAGFFFRRRELTLFAGTIKNADIPMGEVEAGPKGALARFICARHVNRGLMALMSEPGLSKFLGSPVSLFAGPEKANIPTSTSLILKRGYEYVGKVFNELGIAVGGYAIKYEDIFDEHCPVTIFRLSKGVRRGSFFFPVEQKDVLKKYIVSRIS